MNSWLILCSVDIYRCKTIIKLYTKSSGLAGRVLRLDIPDVFPATVAGIFRGGCFSCCLWGDGGWLVSLFMTSVTGANFRHFRSNSWSSHIWSWLPQMQAKRQEFVIWDDGPQLGIYGINWSWSWKPKAIKLSSYQFSDKRNCFSQF